MYCRPMKVQVDLTGLLLVHVQTSHPLPSPTSKMCMFYRYDKAGSIHASLSNNLPMDCQDGSPATCNCHGSVNHLHVP